MPVRKARGFTLIELMVVVAVVGILVAIAYPSFTEYLRKSRRTDGKRAVMEAAAAMEKHFSTHLTYAGATLGTSGIYPASSPDGFYALSFSAAPSAAAYAISAEPTGSQRQDKCHTFTYDQLGVAGVAGGTLAAKDCW